VVRFQAGRVGSLITHNSSITSLLVSKNKRKRERKGEGREREGEKDAISQHDLAQL
jgi:hypothetical protein